MQHLHVCVPLWHFILCLLLLILCHSFVNRHQLKRLKSAHNLVGERNRDLNSARGHIERQADAVEELSRRARRRPVGAAQPDEMDDLPSAEGGVG